MGDLEKAAKAAGKGTMAGEFWYFIKHSKNWWLGPIVILLMLFGVLVLLSGTAAAPFIYTLF